MVGSARSTLLAATISLFTASVAAQSTGNDSCGVDITAVRQSYTIKFRSFCQTKLSSYGNPLPIRVASFRECSSACVLRGKSCGGFAYDRDSHYSFNNCYLNLPTASWLTGNATENAYFDSATIDNSSLPLTRRDCAVTGTGGIYNGFNLRCGEVIHEVPYTDTNILGTVFASSIGDCVDHCKNMVSSSGGALCQAVAWDPTTLPNYQNCALRGGGYYEPVQDTAWDSATLIGTKGIAEPNSTNVTSSTSSSTANPTSTSASQALVSYGGSSQGLPAGAIAGIVVGGIFVLLALGGSILWFFKRRRNVKMAETDAAAVAAGSDTGMTGPRNRLPEIMMKDGRGIHEMPGSSVPPAPTVIVPDSMTR